MLSTTVGQLLINDALPEDLRDYSRKLDKKGAKDLFQKIADKYPDKYRQISKALTDLGHRSAYEMGSFSFGVEDIATPERIRRMKAELAEQVDRVVRDRRFGQKQKEELITKILGARTKELESALYEEMLKKKNPLAMQVLSGARGSPGNLRSLVGSDLLYEDHKGRVVPIQITRSYSQGLRPVEYWAGVYGARKGVIDLKMATSDSGYFCLAEGTHVRMPNGTSVPIEAIHVGDEVLGADVYGMAFPVRVLAIFENGLRDVWSFRFRAGKSRSKTIEICATEMHQVLARIRRGKRGTERGDKDSVFDPTPLSFRRASTGFSLVPIQGATFHGIHEPRALLLGLLLGDGGITGHNINFSSADTGLIDTVNQQMAEIGYRFDKISGHQYEYILHDLDPLPYRHDSTGNRYISCFRHRLRAWLAELKLLGLYSYEKFIPSEVYSWDDQSVAAVLAGLIETDGCISWTNCSSVPTISLAMTSKTIIETARDLLAFRFGIHAGQVIRFNVKGKLHAAGRGGGLIRSNHDVYSITINDRESILRFAEAIKLPGRKSGVLKQLLTEMVPAHRADSYGYHFLDKTYIGQVQTYDIEVDHPDHLFVLANGSIVSNSKQLNQAAHRLIVTDTDGSPPESIRGIPVPVDDPDNEGALLASDVGGYRRNTVVTPKIMAALKAKGHDRILVRSPLVGGPSQGGLYSADVGVRERGGLSPRGDNVGMAAAQAIGEQVSQSAIGSKHTGGVAGAGATISGFKYFNQLAQVPKVYQGGAAHAQTDGKVGSVYDAPAGGKYVMINGTRHYVQTGFNPTVKAGDMVEAGDIISEGLPNPAEIVKHKGIGEGRRYFVDAMRDIARDSGWMTHRRNIELLSRGLINHVRLLEEMGDYNPDDVVQYDTIEHSYQPRDGHQIVPPNRAVGKYLESPILHHTIGTKVRPSMLKDMTRFGVKTVTVHDEPPPFQPEMIRAMENLVHDPDWMTRHLGANLKKSLLTAAHRGAVSDELGTSFVPGLARSEQFGRVGQTKAWKPEDIIQPEDL